MMNLAETTGKIMDSFRKNISDDFNILCIYSDSVCEIRLKAVKEGDKNFHVLVLESIKALEEGGER